MNSLRFFLSLCLTGLVLTGSLLHAQPGSETSEQTGEDSTEILVPPDGNGFTGDRPTGSGTGGTGSPWIDSIYFDGKMVRFTIRLTDAVRRDSARLRALIDSMENSRAAIVAANLRLDPSEWQPTPADRMRREEMIAAAQDQEWIYPQDVTRVPLVSMPLSALGQALGLTEDVSPRISYTLLSTRRITVIIYTQSALPVTTLADGSQKPGEYRLEWDFTDSNGRRALPGSYFVEVIADESELLLRKRIVVP